MTLHDTVTKETHAHTCHTYAMQSQHGWKQRKPIIQSSEFFPDKQ